MGDERLEAAQPHTSLVKAVDGARRSRAVPIAGLAASIVAFVVCGGVIIEHLLTPDFVQVAAWAAVSLIPVFTGLVSRSYDKKSSAAPPQRALSGGAS